MSVKKNLAAFFAVCLLVGNANDALCAGVNLKSKGKNDKPVPIELTSEGGLEWNRSELTLTALKKAIVTRDDLTLAADKITAFYKENGGDIDVYKVQATGRVLIASPDKTIYAAEADFLLPEALIVLKGNPVTLKSGDEKMTAKVLKFWKDDNIAQAEENVVAVKGDRRLEADSVKAFFTQNESKIDVDRFEAYDNVVITNDKERVTGDFGLYNVRKETATLRGNVKISQGNNFIVGEVVDVNMKTGVSRLQTPEDSGRAKGKVRGVFLPETKKKSTKGKKAEEQSAVETKKTQEEKESIPNVPSNEKLPGTTGKAG